MAKSKAEKEPVQEFFFKKAKLTQTKKGELGMEIEYDKHIVAENGDRSITPVIEMPPFHPHQDLLNSLKALVPHWAIDAEEVEAIKLKGSYFEDEMYMQDKDIEKFSVTGVYIKEKHEQRHAVLIGRKRLKSGRVINHSPMFNIEEHEDGYTYSKELEKAVDKFLEEVSLYLEGKHYPSAQLVMFNQDEKEAEVKEEAEKAS